MPKKGSTPRDLILGLLFFGGLFGLAFVTTQLNQVPFMGTRYHLSVLFEDVYGVQDEDKVLVHGTRYGRVLRVDPITPEIWAQTGRDLGAEGLVPAAGRFVPNVLVVLELSHPVEIRADYRVFAEDTNLLGGKAIALDPGTPGAGPASALPDDDGDFRGGDPEDLRQVALVGYPRPHPISALGKLVEDNMGDFDVIVDNLTAASSRLNDPQAGLIGYLLNEPQAVTKLDRVLDRAGELADQAGQEGTLLHDLFYESPLREDIAGAARNVRAFTDTINNQDNVLNRLTAADSPWKADVDAILGEGRTFMSRVNDEGSLIGGLLATGPDSWGRQLDRTLDQVERWVNTATTNPDSLVYQIAHGDLGATVRDAVHGIDNAVAKIDQYVLTPIQDNTSLAGLIFNDPDTRARADRMVKALLGVIEDAREAAPVTSLGSFIFGGF